MRQRWGGWVIGLVFVAVLTAAGVWAYDSSASSRDIGGVVAASGRLERLATHPSSAVGGRLVRMRVREGQEVEPGDTLALMDRRAQETALEAARSAAAAARSAVTAATRQAEALETQLRQAGREAERYRVLHEQEAVPRQAAEQAETAVAQLRSQLRAARAGEELARQRADAEAARVRAARIELDETVVLAPVAGIISEILTREGEIAAPGRPLVAIRAAGDARLKVYLPLEAAERVTPGDSARVWAGAMDDRSFAGVVARIASEAEFTPRDVHMPDERTTLVYEVTIRVADPDRVLKDGLPADAWLRWDPRAPWPEAPPW